MMRASPRCVNSPQSVADGIATDAVVGTRTGPPFADHSSRFGTNGTQAHFPGLHRRFSVPFAQDRFFEPRSGVGRTDVLKEAGICISMDGQGRWMDNVFIERLWRSLKYECVYLSEFATGSQARIGIGWWMDFYNRRRPHSALNDRTPQEAYTDGGTTRKPADEAA